MSPSPYEYQCAIKGITDLLRQKRAYFALPGVGHNEIVSCYEKTMHHICLQKGIPFLTPTTVDQEGSTLLFYVAAENLTILIPHLIQMGYDPTHRNLQ